MAREPTRLDEPEIPIVVTNTTMPESIGIIIRVALLFIGGSLVTKGWLPADSDINLIAGAAVTAIGAIWGLVRAVSTKKKLIVTADAAPNQIARLKG